MDFSTLAPSDELAADIGSLTAVVEADQSGEKSRRLIQYFKQAETQTVELSLRSMDYEEKKFASLLGEAFAASRRILMTSWHKAHGGELV